MMNTEHRFANKHSGFTLVELMIAMVVAFLVSAAVYASYKIQQQTHKAQMQVTEIQQNLRAAMDMINREFRISGYDPKYTGEYLIPASYTFSGQTYTNNSTTFVFYGDLCEEVDPPNTPNGPAANCQASSPYAGQSIPEIYLYEHYDSDVPTDGIPDAIRRTPGGAAIAENIEKVDFVYILESGTEQPSLTSTTVDKVRAVKVSLLGRASEPDFKYTDDKTYPYGTGMTWDPSTFASASCDNNNCLNYRRRALVSVIELRNSGQE